MFDLPQAKRVRREDLYSNSRSPTSSPEPELTDLFLQRFQSQYAEESSPSALNEALDAADGVPLVDEDLQEQEVEFRLFGAAQDVPVAKIRVRSPTLMGDSNGALRARPRRYYLKEALSREEEKRLQSVAVSGDDVYAQSRRANPGCKLPWRVTILDCKSFISKVGTTVLDDHNTTGKKRRKGKKARIATRKKGAKDKERKRIEDIAAVDKELAEKMKKAKKNRDKKLRQRQKEKEKKAAARALSGDAMEISEQDSE